MDPPECPICLQPFDSVSTIPRVLHCGHTACESCLGSLPERYPLTVRCPVCNQLVKFPSELGPISLPKNIDLLRLIDMCPRTDGNKKKYLAPALPSYSRLWSAEFFSKWRKRIIDQDALSTAGAERILMNRRVHLLKVSEVKKRDSSIAKLDYTVEILNALHRMSERERDELNFIIQIGTMNNRCNRMYGLWSDSGEGTLYLVCDRLRDICMFDDLLTDDYVVSDFAMIGMEMCEAIMSLHIEGTVAGCLSSACFELDQFGRLTLSLREVLMVSKELGKCFSTLTEGDESLEGKKLGDVIVSLLKNGIYLSPELIPILKEKSLAWDRESKGGIVQVWDVWPLGCILSRLLLGKKFTDVLNECADSMISDQNLGTGGDYSSFFVGFALKVKYLLQCYLGKNLESVREILSRCLEYDPRDRPLVSVVWNCIRDLIVKRPTDKLKTEVLCETESFHMVLAKLYLLEEKKPKICKEDGLFRLASDETDKDDKINVNNQLIEAIIEGNVLSKDMLGHRDCITGLAVGGGFLFSTSYDKLIHVWSLQDFSHIHAFSGHNYKVMAVTYVDEEQLCITGDGEGGIYFWSTKAPLQDQPIKKFYEKKDWRYSGIHALTTAGNGYLYTGNGDRSVKHSLLSFSFL